MTDRNVFQVNYEQRLFAVTAALHAAEAEQRFGEAESLRLAQGVLRVLIQEQKRPTAAATSAG